MKIKKPAETVEVCDFCTSGGYLEKCIICKRQFCLLCQGILIGDVCNQTLCKECKKREDVRKIIKIYHRVWLRARSRQEEQLKKLPKKEKVKETQQ